MILGTSMFLEIKDLVFENQ